MSITIDENEQFAGNEFTPFHDGDAARAEKAKTLYVNATQGYDTRAFDRFRQGVSIRTSKHVYGSTQPKIWSGNIRHYVKVETFGQARDFTEYDNSAEFGERPIFDPVWYIEAQENYPFPIVFNNGPQQEEEASIEPFVIPFRKPNPYGNVFAHSVKAGLEDGNSFDNLDGGTTRVEQFVEYNTPATPRFFLDEGVEYFGPTIPTGSLLTNTYSPVANYQFNGDTLDSSGNSYDLSKAVGTEQYVTGPVPGTQALFLDGATAFSSSIVPELHLSKSMTLEVVIKLDPNVASNLNLIATIAGDISSTAEVDTTLFTLGNNGADDTGSAAGAKYFTVSYSSGSNSSFTNLQTGKTDTDFRNWFHIVVTRNSASNSIFYLNGVPVSTLNHSGFPAADTSNAFLQVGGGWNGGVSWPTTVMFHGLLSSLKILDKELTQAQVTEEFKKALPYASGEVNRVLQSSIVIDGFTAFNQRDVDPFNDTRDEQIVEQISTTSAEFIAELKKLKFELDEDIRGTYDKKSATAGNVVYGNGAAQYGTDSITFVGTARGS